MTTLETLRKMTRDLGVSEMARRLGVHRTTLTSYLAGAARPATRLLIETRFADANA